MAELPKVGDMLVLKSSGYRGVIRFNDVRVTKIGRSWVYYEGISKHGWPVGRFSREVWAYHGHSEKEGVYPNRETFFARAVDAHHRNLVVSLLHDHWNPNNPLRDASIEVVRQVAALLNIELSDPEFNLESSNSP